MLDHYKSHQVLPDIHHHKKKSSFISRVEESHSMTKEEINVT